MRPSTLRLRSGQAPAQGERAGLLLLTGQRRKLEIICPRALARRKFCNVGEEKSEIASRCNLDAVTLGAKQMITHAVC